MNDDAKLGLLGSLDVEVHRIRDGDTAWPDYYAQTIKAIRKDVA